MIILIYQEEEEEKSAKDVKINDLKEMLGES
jgi:hypothetical protein